MGDQRITIDAVFIKGTGTIERGQYPNGTLALVFVHDGDRDVLSVNLQAYGIVPPENHIYIPEYGVHEGVPGALTVTSPIPVARFVFEPGHRGDPETVVVRYGGYDASAVLMEVLA